jgi:phospholipase D1/2
MNAFGLSRIPGDALKELYGSFGDTVLYWAHHEKLCVVDRNLVFMGGLDMCMPTHFSFLEWNQKLILP